MTEKRATLDRIQELIQDNLVEEAREFLAEAHPADIAEIYLQLPPGSREAVLALLPSEGLADLLGHLDADLKEELLRRLPRAALAKALDHAGPDMAVDVLQSLSEGVRNSVLSQMSTSEQIAPLLAHAPESAGGRMTTQYLAVTPDMTAQQMLRLFQVQRPINHEIRYLYVLDDAKRLMGVVSLRSVLISPPSTRMEDLMVTDVRSVTPETDQEEAAQLLQRYRLRALPVVDEFGVLEGIITADDVLDVVVAEATEDIHHMAGLGVNERITTPLLESAARRLPWLSINMIWAFAGAAIIHLFQGTLEQVAALVVFMPLIAGQAGNAGIQTSTIVVRSMALGDFERLRVSQVLAKEWGVGLIKGTVFGLILAMIAWLLKGNIVLGAIAGGALFLNILVASTSGVLVPVTLRRLGVDPALVAGVFDTMLSDLMGFLIYLGLATLFLAALLRAG
ncbi:MAG: magnesium transporter [Dehalococcoidia bacterium]|nr:magnesium transporter [Dehalococcoidia bacterium]